MCDLEAIGESSIFKLIRRTTVLTRMCPIVLNGEEKTGGGMNQRYSQNL